VIGSGEAGDREDNFLKNARGKTDFARDPPIWVTTAAGGKNEEGGQRRELRRSL